MTPARFWPFLALALVTPFLGAFGDPLGDDAYRVMFAVVVVGLAIAFNRVARLPGRTLLVPVCLALTVLPGIRSLPAIGAATPVLIGALLVLAAAGLRSPQDAAGRATLAWTIILTGAVVAVWGLVDAFGGGRGVVSLGNANRVGEFAAVVIPLAAVAFFSARRAHATLAFVALIAVFAQLIITQSRGGLLVGLIELAVAAALLGRRPEAPHAWRRAALVGLTALGIGAALWALPQTRPRVDHAIERITRGLSPDYPSNRVRFGVAKGAARLAAERPLGVGAGGFEDAFVPWRDEAEHRISGWRSTVPDAHNQYLHSGVEGGWLAALAVLALWFFVGTLPRPRAGAHERELELARAATPILAIGLAIYCLFGTPLENTVAIIAMAIIAGTAIAATGPAEPRADRSSRSALVVRVASVAVLIGLAVWQSRAVRSQRARIDAARLLTEANARLSAMTAPERQQLLQRLTDAWRRAGDITPERAQIWERIGTYKQAFRRHEAALRAFARATEAAPHAVGPRLGAARSHRALGQPAAALALIEATAADQPWHPFPYARLAAALRALGRETDALAADRSFVERSRGPNGDPANDSAAIAAAGRRVAAGLVATAGEGARALAAYRAAISFDPDEAHAHRALARDAQRRGDTTAFQEHRYLAHLAQAKQNARQALDFKDRRSPTKGWERLFEKGIGELKYAARLFPERPEPYYFEAAIRALRSVDKAPYHDREIIGPMYEKAKKRGMAVASPRDTVFRAALERYRGDDE